MGWARQFADLFDSVIATTALKPAWRKKRREISIWPKNAAPLRFWNDVDPRPNRPEAGDYSYYGADGADAAADYYGA